MNKKTRLGIIFSLARFLFMTSFFSNIGISIFATGFLLFVSLLFRAITPGPLQIWSAYKKYIIGGMILAFLGISVSQNLYQGLSFLILSGGIIYALRYLYKDKQSNTIHSIRGYAVYGLIHLVYFLGFATATHLVGGAHKLELDCKQIYGYYQQASLFFSSTKSYQAEQTLSRPDMISSKADAMTNNYPQLKKLLQQLKIYEQDISTSISDQQSINKEICVLVTSRINDIYSQGNVKIGLIILVGLFLYPFFTVLFYVYGGLSYLLLRVALHYGLFSYAKKMVEKTELE